MPSVAVISWPVIFMGYATVDGYGYDSGHDVVGYNVADGHTQYRRGQLDPPSVVKMAFLMSKAQFQFFEGFYRWTLNKGSLWFSMQFRTGLGLIEADCHVTTAGYVANHIKGGDSWDVTFAAELGYSRLVRDAAVPWLLNGGGGTWRMNGNITGSWLTNSGGVPTPPVVLPPSLAFDWQLNDDLAGRFWQLNDAGVDTWESN